MMTKSILKLVVFMNVLGLSALAQESEYQITGLNGLSVSLQEIDYDGRGNAAYPDKIEFKGDLSHIFGSLNTSLSTAYMFTDKQPYFLKIQFQEELRVLSDSELQDIFEKISTTLGCQMTTESNEVTMFELMTSDSLKSDKSMESNPGVLNKVESKGAYWKGWNVSTSEIANFIMNYYRVPVRLASDSTPKINITIDKRLSFEENRDMLEHKYGLMLHPVSGSMTTFKAQDCTSPD